MEFVLSVVILYTLQKHYSESRDIDTISRVHGELDELKNIMVKNIGELVAKCYSSHYFLDKRGQKLMLLVSFNGSIIL
jgi:vesicle-associated membrane protein 7